MAKVNYYLRDINSVKDTPIILFFSFHGHRLKYYIGQSVNPKKWNFNTRRARNTENDSYLASINAELDRLQNVAHTAFNQSITQGRKPTEKTIRDALDAATGKIELDRPTLTLLEFVDQFIKKRENGRRYRPGSIQVYRSCEKHLKVFCPGNISLDDLDRDFFEGFTSYLYRQSNPQSDNLFTQNYVNKLITTLKTMLNEAVEDGYTNNIAHRRRGLAPGKDDVDKIYLSKDELKTLFHLDLTSPVRLDRRTYKRDEMASLDLARDFFLIGSFTGLRYADFTQIKAGNIAEQNGRYFIRKRTQKTGQTVYVPLNAMAQAIIIDKYDRHLPGKISNQNLNQDLKVIGRIAGLTSKMVISRNEGGEQREREYQKWELITTHTARRSFATNAYLDGVPVPTIMKLTGHTTTASFLRYIRADSLLHGMMAADHEHFLNY